MRFGATDCGSPPVGPAFIELVPVSGLTHVAASVSVGRDAWAERIEADAGEACDPGDAHRREKLHASDRDRFAP